MSITAVVVATLPVWLKLILAILVAISLYYHLKQHTRPIQLVWRNGNRWFINDEKTATELRSIDFFSRWLVIISLSPEAAQTPSLKSRAARTRRFIIPFDALDTDTFRLLRVRLRIEGFELLNPTDEGIR